MLCSARAPRPPRSSRVAISSAVRTRRVIFLRYLIIHCFCRCFVRVRDVGDLVPVSVSILQDQAGASSPPCTRVFGFVRTVSSSLPRGEGTGKDLYDGARKNAAGVEVREVSGSEGYMLGPGSGRAGAGEGGREGGNCSPMRP